MNSYIVIFQFERDSVKPWSQSQIQQVMTKHRATYVTRGVYIVSMAKSAVELRDKIIQAGELTNKDFIGVYPTAGAWSSMGACQRGASQPVWPSGEEPSGEPAIDH